MPYNQPSRGIVRTPQDPGFNNPKGSPGRPAVIPNNNGPVNMNNFPRIKDMLNRGLDKSQVVSKLTDTKNNSGGASQLGKNQLKAIGFGPKYIQKVLEQNKPKAKNQKPWYMPGSDAKNPYMNGGPGDPTNPKPKPKPGSKEPSLEDYLMGDEVYLDQQSMFQKLLEDFELSNANQQGDVEEDFTLAMERLGEERGRSLEDMEADYAARNMMYSGLYPEAISDYDEQYQDRVFDLNKDKGRILEDLLEQLGMFKNNMSMEEQAAKQEAILRFTEEFGDLGEMPLGPGAKPKPKKSNASKSSVNMKNFPRIQKLLKKNDGDKSDVVKALVGKGNASKLGPNQLKAIGFGSQFIKNNSKPKKKPAKKKPAKKKGGKK